MGANLTFNDNDDVQLKGATTSTLIGNVGDQLKLYQSATNSAVYAALVADTVAIPARVGATNLANRRSLIIQVLKDQVYIGFDSSVTTSTGLRIYQGTTVTFDIGPAITAYLIADGHVRDVRIIELS